MRSRATCGNRLAAARSRVYIADLMEPKILPPRSAAAPAVVLVSGGLDSATVLSLAGAAGYAVHALSVDYGQRHRIELEAARAIALHAQVQEHRIVQVDLRAFGGSALTDQLEVPKDQLHQQTIPITYVPARNTIMLSLALAFAEVIGASDIFFGANAVDFSGYPDCRPEFVAAFEQLARTATATTVLPIRIQAPLMSLSKAEIVRAGGRFGVPWQLTISCYDPDRRGAACGCCDACLLRKNGFVEAGVADPTTYQTRATRERV